MRPAVSALAFTLTGFFAGAVFFITASLVLAWTGPSSAPPNGNVSAPINVGTVDQIKNAGLGINSLAVFGNAILASVGSYLNFGPTAGTSGYGFRDNAGTMEFKNSTGAWTGIGSASGGSQWTTSGSSIYYTGGTVGIGTASPATPLDVVGPASVTSFTGTTKLGVMIRSSTAATDYSGLDFTGNNQTTPVGRIAILTTAGGSYMKFGTSNAYANGVTNTAMTIDTTGHVGIGTTNPTAKLHIGGTPGVDGIKFPDGTTQTTAAPATFPSGSWCGVSIYNSGTYNSHTLNGSFTNASIPCNGQNPISGCPAGYSQLVIRTVSNTADSSADYTASCIKN